MNYLHLHMYNVGLLTLAQMLVIYPSQNSASIVLAASDEQNKKGSTSGKGKG